MPLWPTPGKVERFTCNECGAQFEAVYDPSALSICPGCGSPISLPPPLMDWLEDDLS